MSIENKRDLRNEVSLNIPKFDIYDYNGDVFGHGVFDDLADAYLFELVVEANVTSEMMKNIAHELNRMDVIRKLLLRGDLDEMINNENNQK